MKISNSGKTITIRMPDGHIGDRFKIIYTPSNIALLVKCGPDDGHLVHSTNCLTLNSKHFPNWPIHGQIEPKHWWEALANRYRVEMPEGPLPPPKIINRKKRSVPVDDAALGFTPLAEAMKIVERAGMNRPEKEDISEPLDPSYFETTEPREEAIITFKGKTYLFNVPTSEVIDLVLDWGSRGFGVR